jgi:hypothetical protein
MIYINDNKPVSRSLTDFKKRFAMIISTKSGFAVDTSKDLSAPERHILQKLMLWKDMAVSVEDFRQQKAEALRQGWNDSGPIPESRALGGIIQDLEYMVAQRLLAEKMGH